MFPVEVGKEYDVHHSRKGNFRIKVNGLHSTMIQATITQGKARFISESDRGPGERIGINREFPGLVLTSVDA